MRYERIPRPKDQSTQEWAENCGVTFAYMVKENTMPVSSAYQDTCCFWAMHAWSHALDLLGYRELGTPTTGTGVKYDID
jgi:hypothetical protein